MKKRAILKTLSTMIAAVMTLSMPVCAANTEYNNAENGSVPVSVTVDSTYTVSLPAGLTLQREGSTNNFTGTVTVGVKANLTDSEKVTVTPANTFVMTNNSVGNVTANASATQKCQNWFNQTEPFTYTEGSSTSQKANKDNFENVNCNISVELPVAGSYTGTLNFTFSKGSKA